MTSWLIPSGNAGFKWRWCCSSLLPERSWRVLVFTVSCRTPWPNGRTRWAFDSRWALCLSDIRRLVVTQGFTPVLIGLGAGVLGSVGVGRLLGTLLFGITPTDPLTLTAVVAVFVTVALAAMYVPAQRAIRVDPLQALRQD